ncbi:MAG: shikimate kinase [Clostridia bacterium]|nr:shikimate kinase [Clostridia bacterium]
MKKDIILIGMPGCGKSTLGRKLASVLNRPFLDLDTVIEETSGKKISDIFDQDGEAGFRKLETQAFHNIAGFGGVLATGGGVVTVPGNLEIAKQGLIVFVDRPLAALLDTISTAERPLLKGGKERLITLYEQRYDLYHNWAKIHVENTGTMEEAIEKIIKEVEYYENYGN